jgi:hypothetical protein
MVKTQKNPRKPCEHADPVSAGISLVCQVDMDGNHVGNPPRNKRYANDTIAGGGDLVMMSSLRGLALSTPKTRRKLPIPFGALGYFKVEKKLHGLLKEGTTSLW